MKYLCVIGVLLAGVLSNASAATTINAANKFSYGANIGWMDWRGDVANGAVIGQFTCSGYIYAANTGWIHLGDGASVNNLHYQNNAANDYGVNHDGAGNLSGLAYSANTGWINFGWAGPNDPNRPRFDLLTGNFSFQRQPNRQLHIARQRG